jgi:hypothetical protein
MLIASAFQSFVLVNDTVIRRASQGLRGEMTGY